MLPADGHTGPAACDELLRALLSAAVDPFCTPLPRRQIHRTSARGLRTLGLHAIETRVIRSDFPCPRGSSVLRSSVDSSATRCQAGRQADAVSDRFSGFDQLAPLPGRLSRRDWRRFQLLVDIAGGIGFRGRFSFGRGLRFRNRGRLGAVRSALVLASELESSALARLLGSRTGSGFGAGCGLAIFRFFGSGPRDPPE